MPKEVCCIIHSIVMHHQGKSMVSEEIELNHYLAVCGIKAVTID